MTRRLMAGLLVLGALCGPAGCAPRKEDGAARPAGTCTGFALSLVARSGGQTTPVAAAVWIARRGKMGPLPRAGWHVVGTGRRSATVTSGHATVHAVRGTDHTWQVDSGENC